MINRIKFTLTWSDFVRSPVISRKAFPYMIYSRMPSYFRRHFAQYKVHLSLQLNSDFFVTSARIYPSIPLRDIFSVHLSYTTWVIRMFHLSKSNETWRSERDIRDFQLSAESNSRMVDIGNIRTFSNFFQRWTCVEYLKGVQKCLVLNPFHLPVNGFVNISVLTSYHQSDSLKISSNFALSQK